MSETVTEHERPYSEVLADFISEAERSPAPASLNELQQIITPDVVLALSNLIKTEGTSSRPKGSRELKSRSFLTMVIGSVDPEPWWDNYPDGISLTQYRRTLSHGYVAKSWVMFLANGDLSREAGININNGQEAYFLSRFSRPAELGKFLKVTSRLTRSLIKVSA